MSPRFAALALPALTCLCALAAPLAARADAAPAEASSPVSSAPAIRPLAGVRYTIGEGESSKALLKNHDGTPRAEVDLAGIIDIYAGAEFPLAPNGLALQLTAGLHQSTSSNGISARQYPLEALLLYPASPTLRVGGGVRYTINTYVSVRFDYGFQLVHTGFDADHGSRSDLGVMISY